MADRLNSGESLSAGTAISSQDGRFTLNMQTDGNLVLYGPGDRYRWDTATNGRPVAQAVMQGDGNLVMYGPNGDYVWDTATDGHPGAWLVVQNDGNGVIYGPEGNALWATNTGITRVMVPGFSPTSSGLHFANDFPSVPHFTINVLGAQVSIGDAANGLCGGMVFTVRDYFEAESPPPRDTNPPSSGALYNYLVNRLYDSFNLPFGPMRYMDLMNPSLPDHETDLSRMRLAPHGRAWVMINEEWPKIRADLNNGRLSPLALVTIKSLDPLQMGQNHQVLAYGYELDLDNLVLCVYDPNSPNNNNLKISLSLADPQHTTTVSYSGILGGDHRIWCFFRPEYTFSSPPGVILWQADWRWCHKCQGLFFSGEQSSVGTCPAGGQHDKAFSGNYTLAHNQQRFPGQADWRWCHKCQGLFFSGGHSSVGSCPAGDQHEKGMSGNYTLTHNEEGFPGQADWRWCHKCQGLFFSGGQNSTGICPTGGQHEKGWSGNYALIHTPANT